MPDGGLFWDGIHCLAVPCLLGSTALDHSRLEQEHHEAERGRYFTWSLEQLVKETGAGDPEMATSLTCSVNHHLNKICPVQMNN